MLLIPNDLAGQPQFSELNCTSIIVGVSLMVLRYSSRLLYRFDSFEVDVRAAQLRKCGRRLRLTGQPVQILVMLLEHPGEVVAREELQQRLWLDETFVDFENSVNKSVSSLRQALGDSATEPKYIETLPRRGYRFLAPVETVTDPPLATPVPIAAPAIVEPFVAPQIARPGIVRTHPPYRKFLVAATAFALLLCVGLVVARSRKSAAAVTGLGTKLAPNAGKVDPQAYEEYLQAQRYWKERTAESLKQTIENYNRAIEREPNYAEAYAGLANAYAVLPVLSSVPKQTAYAQARRAADKAISLNDSLSSAHLALAEVRLYDDWDFPGADKEFNRAIELDPSYAQAHQWYAEYLSLMSRHEEAIREIIEAKQFDPQSMIIYHQAGQIFRDARRYDEALQHYQKALEMQPGFGPTYSEMAILYEREGKLDDMLEMMRRSHAYWDPGIEAGDFQQVVEAYKHAGSAGYYRARIEYEKKYPGHLYFRALNYALAGDKEQALHWLQKSLDAKEIQILGIRNDPGLDSLRGDPRFEAIVRSVGFTEP